MSAMEKEALEKAIPDLIAQVCDIYILSIYSVVLGVVLGLSVWSGLYCVDCVKGREGTAVLTDNVQTSYSLTHATHTGQEGRGFRQERQVKSGPDPTRDGRAERVSWP